MAELPKVIGGAYNFWLYSPASGYDITHPKTPSAPKVYPHMKFKTGSTHLALDPFKTALVVVGMQNYFISPALHRPSTSPGLQVAEKLKNEVIPACRKADIRVLWLNWGLKPLDIVSMPPTIKRGFALDNNFEDGYKIPELGVDIGPVQIDEGFTIDGGKVLMRDTWNEEIYDPLAALVERGDMKAWKNRLSGFWRDTETENMLKMRNIKTLIFAGCNTDQSVAASLMDAAWNNWDCILLSDATATTSPSFAQEAVEYNMEGLGFKMTCEDLVNGTFEDDRGMPPEERAEE
ncbi:Isochorismatase hydrolase [Karstenula rhodostoma CBS 690.94]|uniref:Isochorismatase hydrolase n=1 Tax=Karstenula rhodostoma CBS 690.94 TaxID=1392251 RepID=A0A9P4U5Q5_9PLEO|nr:Isochorismatase hydrolase [Karstenula rhodostoma CBS 690.94]